MKNIIINYINTLKKEDIINFANKNNLVVSDKEIEFVYSFIKNNYNYVLDNPNNFNIEAYKDNFSNDNYEFIKELINKYINLIK